MRNKIIRAGVMDFVAYAIKFIQNKINRNK